MKALIAYGTRYGATAGTAEEIAKILHENGLDARTANLKTESVQSILDYDLIIVGSGMAMGNWTGEAEEFVKKFQLDFGKKKLALFISSLNPIEEKKGKIDLVNRIHKIGIDDKISKYNLVPIAVGVFGGIINYPKISFILRKGMEVGYKADLKKFGFKEVEPNVFDLRDWDEIHKWTIEVAKKAQE